jgi:hypothetical protein
MNLCYCGREATTTSGACALHGTLTPPAPPALTAAEMVEKLTWVLEHGSGGKGTRERVEAVRAALAAPPPDAGLVALVEHGPVDRLIVRLLDKLTHWSDGDETDRAVIAKFEAERWKLLGVPLPARPTETPT